MNNPQYKLFVPNPDKYLRYFQLQASGMLDLYTNVMRGGRLRGSTDVDACLALYDHNIERKHDKKQANEPSIVMTSPTEQIVTQAKAKQERQKSIKEGKTKPMTIQGNKRKGNGSISPDSFFKFSKK